MTKGQPRACVCLNWPMDDLEDFYYDEEDDEDDRIASTTPGAEPPRDAGILVQLGHIQRT